MNNNIDEDIEAALDLIKFKFFIFDKEFTKYSSIYPFTNENLNGYFDKLSIINKSVLTVAGSGDHYLELLIRNSNNIEIFDINILTKYYMALKVAGIKALDYNEFISYFFLERNYLNTFNKDSYLKIRKYLNENDLIFWDALYTKYSGNIIRSSRLFYRTEETYLFLRTFISYLNPDNYQTIKEKLQNTDLNFENKFYNCNMKELESLISKKFDIILLSNIADYLNETYKIMPAEKFKKYILKELTNLLNNEGIICVAYLFWANATKQKSIPLINRKTVRQKHFKDEFEEWIIDNSTVKDCSNDHLLVYKKQK